MKKIIDEIKEIGKEKTITFSENFYKSTDNKTIMGEVPFKQILFLDYRETEAGSNPREYNGLKKANLNILQSLLKDYRNMFRFLHSGIIVSLVNPIFKNDRIVQYDDCCLTNGNQTRFIILILSLLKFLSDGGKLRDITRPQFQTFLKNHFDNIESTKNIVKYIKFNKLDEVATFIKRTNRYLESFEKLDMQDFLNARIRILVNIIDFIIEDMDEPLDNYSAGTLIAQANNDTQNVKVDDIFGNKYKRELTKNIFKDFVTVFKDKVRIEFRYGEIEDRIDKVHILTLLRPVVATGILTPESSIFKLTNQRAPVYKLFEKLLKKDNVEKTISATSKLIPLLYKLRVKYVEPYLDKHKRNLTRKYKEKAISDDLDGTFLASRISTVKNNDQELEKLIKTNVNYNIEHIMPVLVHRIKLLFRDTDNRLELTVPPRYRSAFFEGLIGAIYEKYIEMKLRGLPTSLTTEVRDKKFYEFGSEAYTAFKSMYKFQETDYIAKNRHIIE